MELQPTTRPTIVNGELARKCAGPKYSGQTLAIWPGESEFDFSDCHCPQGAPGDGLWVRETHEIAAADDYVVYRADRMGRNMSPDGTLGEPYYMSSDYQPEKWRQSIFMPKWACRLRLTLTDVGAEQLHDISNEDARAEGVPQTAAEAHEIGMFNMDKEPGHVWDNRSSAENYMVFWDSINGKKWPSKTTNPWVWVETFEVREAV
jgi:hypothetical protein